MEDEINTTEADELYVDEGLPPEAYCLDCKTVLRQSIYTDSDTHRLVFEDECPDCGYTQTSR